MNIPQSAIEPFEPHGIPSLGIDDNHYRKHARNICRMLNDYARDVTKLQVDLDSEFIKQQVEWLAREHGCSFAACRLYSVAGKDRLFHVAFYKTGYPKIARYAFLIGEV